MATSGRSAGSHPDGFESPNVSYSSPPFLHRTAVNPNGTVGSVYDITRDQIVNQSISFPEQSTKLTRQPTCLLDKPGNVKLPNLLNLIRLDPALRVSIALELAPATRLAECFDYKKDFNRYTRLLSYSLVSRTVQIPNHELERLHATKPSASETSASHIIVQIQFGIDAFVILQLPQDDAAANQIDLMLERMSCDMAEDRPPKWNANELQTLQSIRQPKIYSNISSLKSIKTIVEFQREIHRLRHDTDFHNACSYVLCPLNSLFTLSSKSFVGWNERQLKEYESVEQYMIDLTSSFEQIRYAMDHEYPLCQKYLKHQLDETGALLYKARQLRNENVKRLQRLVCSIRRGESNPPELAHALQDTQTKGLTETLGELVTKLASVRNKESFIRIQLPREFQYRHAMDFNITENDDDSTLQKKLMGNERNVLILCSDDDLYEDQPSEWNRLYEQLLNEHRQRPNLRLLYVDFTDHPYQLSQFKVFPLKETAAEQNDDDEDDTINILLLGQSGAGKSTFINAVANYLRFKTFSEAAANQPSVLIETLFSLVSGPESKEFQAKCDGLGTAGNEDHQHPGQSTTQHCRSYIFTIEDDQKKKTRKLRLIDTPGFGDARGFEQDEQKLKEIFLFANHLKRLHAICMLTKANVAELHPVFRSYLLYLLDFLGKNARDNILFCFTHTRAFYFTPRSSSRAVIKALEAFPVKGIKFTDQDALCFDNEAFLYLVAKERGVPFSSEAITRHRSSWEKSVKETGRLLQTLLTTMRPYEIPTHCRSLKRAQLEVQLLIRPIMETIRNILRNVVLSGTTSTAVVIELYPIATDGYTATCCRCKHSLQECAAFYILSDTPHVIGNQCLSCTCPLNDHTIVHYELDYQEQTVASNESVEEIRTLAKTLGNSSVLFSYFLNNGGGSSPENDEVLFQLEKMIHEEECICAKYQSAPLNPMLVTELKNIKQQYQQQMENMLKQQERPADLMTICKSIDQVNQVDSIRSQMDAIRQWHESLFRQSEICAP